MASPVRRTPKRERRSHAERTAATRLRIVEAVIESIAEVGFQRTTAVEITRRAGVTWGAVQHHFGDKDGILIAEGVLAAAGRTLDGLRSRQGKHFGNARTVRNLFDQVELRCATRLAANSDGAVRIIAEDVPATRDLR